MSFSLMSCVTTNKLKSNLVILQLSFQLEESTATSKQEHLQTEELEQLLQSTQQPYLNT